MQKLISKTLLFAIVASLAGMNACKQTDVKAGDELVNEFVSVNMDYWYYWKDKIPAGALENKSLAPETFFNSLLYTFDKTARPDGDRFSRFLENAEETESSLSGESKTTGARLALYNSNNTIAAFVMYVFPGSPAAKAGIKRGDVFSKITVDGQLATVDNYGSLLAEGTNYVYTVGRYENKAFVSGDQTKTVVAQPLQEDPMLLDTVYTKGTKKIGYLVYNRFYSKPNNSEQPLYDQKMATIFGKFKAAGINEFILDLRYNGGGYTSTARTLGSFIAKGVTDKTVFSRDEYNATVTPELEKKQGKDFNVNYFQPKTENIGGNVQRVYVLVSSRTASASELVINGLKPFMDVFIIGDVTVGKNVGSILIKDPKNRFPQGMMPIVIKVFNSAGQSDYTAGFTPNVLIKEDISQPFYAFGDLREPLLSEAYFQITGNRSARRGVSETPDSDRLRIGPSLIETEMIVDRPFLK
ncbi:peptidase S41 [Runella rosea]|uniref:Peptidase S41 n=1 Tax=Runella rosea TaxID=2259595 RepID=A0A344TH08_9BACT|nr:S41 family peptidase [Runella rosea]AXE17929.1 peptidase S41 [Runella rosea]